MHVVPMTYCMQHTKPPRTPNSCTFGSGAPTRSFPVVRRLRWLCCKHWWRRAWTTPVTLCDVQLCDRLVVAVHRADHDGLCMHERAWGTSVKGHMRWKYHCITIPHQLRMMPMSLEIPNNYSMPFLILWRSIGERYLPGLKRWKRRGL